MVQGNPADLIRQARRSVSGCKEDEVPCVAHRDRRRSAPSAPVPAEAQESPQKRSFKTRRRVSIRTMPSGMSVKIGEFPEGWKVVEGQWDGKSPSDGWVPIEPRGFVPAEDLEPASPVPLEKKPARAARRTEVPGLALSSGAAKEAPPSRTPLSARAVETTARTPLSSRGRCQSPRFMPCQGRDSPLVPPAPRAARAAPKASPGAAAGGQPRTSPRQATLVASTQRQARSSVGHTCRAPPPSPATGSSPQDASAALALREEHVQLRELNVQLSEKELQKRSELQDLDRVRETLAREVQELERSRKLLHDQHAAEQLELERRQDHMKDKLLRCRDAVAFAVGSIDVLYEEQDRSANGGAALAGSPPPATSPLGAEGPSGVEAARATAVEAGAEVSAVLATLQEEEEDEDPGQENTASINVVEVGLTTGIICAAKKTDEHPTPDPDRTPLSAHNKHL